jgi:DNA polymerase III subunit alpha
MSQYFTHLHIHTDYSLLDGAITLERLVDFAKSKSMKAIGISDHGNVFGAVKFFQLAKKAGIKPILGIEAYITDDVRVKEVENKYYHIVIIVKNNIGYKNLCKLISLSYTEGFYFKPRIDYRMLEAHAEGLILTTACLGGHIPQLIMQGKDDQVETLLDWYLRVFGHDHFYLEVQPEDQPDQKILNEKLFDLSARKGIQCVATGDCHYVTAEDREAHEVMLAIQTHHKMSDPDRFTFGACRVHMRTQEEMLEIFKDHQDAVWASGRIADLCNFTFETGKLLFPQFEIPEDTTEESYFAQMSKSGLTQLLEQGRIPKEQELLYLERLNREIELIIAMGFVGYFLVVSDFIQWARNSNIPVGPGRGSVAGSLVAWALRITDIDPIKYNLLFERFLNPERISMPDIDIDFCIEGRDKVINYVRKKYGYDKVCQIITFGTMMAKGVLKDVARALGFPFEDSNALTDLIPDQLKITLKEALEQESQLRDLVKRNSSIEKLFEIATRLEGLTRHASKHAAGIVISPEPISEVLPVYIPPKSADLVTQYAMTELESLGFLKMDFLGLKNLTLVQQTCDLVARNHGVILDIATLPLEDTKTFDLVAKGRTAGVFQLESEGLQDVLRRLQPSTFEDIIAVNALYRPGPLGSGMVDDFIERRHRRQKVSYLFPDLEDILQETYGVIVYQEQVMKIASVVGGYSLGEADILRRAMGKKKADVMIEQKEIFVQRAAQKSFDVVKAGELFDLMAYFAGYGFNKSHSAAYALIAYQTAYLKTHYPAEFMACLISLESADAEKMAFYIQEAKDMHLQIVAPSINISEPRFSVYEGIIRFGLQGIKNVGFAALENIIQERSQKQPFRDMLDFCMRVDLRICNKRVIESLICAGAFDDLPGNRAQKYEELTKIIDHALEKKRALATGQMGLFAYERQNGTEKDDLHEVYHFSERAEWSMSVKLEKEKEVLGIYSSAQPLDTYTKHLKCLSILTFNDVRTKTPGATVICSGLLKQTKAVTTKKGEKMAFLSLEDREGKAEVVLFPKLLLRVNRWLEEYTVFIIKGVVDEGSATLCKIKAQELWPLDLILQEGIGITGLGIVIPQAVDKHVLESLKSSLIPGQLPLTFIFSEKTKKLKLTSRTKIAYTPQLATILESCKFQLRINL